MKIPPVPHGLKPTFLCSAPLLVLSVSLLEADNSPQSCAWALVFIAMICWCLLGLFSVPDTREERRNISPIPRQFHWPNCFSVNSFLFIGSKCYFFPLEAIFLMMKERSTVTHEGVSYPEGVYAHSLLCGKCFHSPFKTQINVLTV